ncbi:hypothetical protein DPEC_G00076580 [Dallia pectoralis]|uniref:Uncharacterized protein n=1 Tax=Dallia pectoralis TaxID=75939 RepID=A0ACC2H4W0_DALPE|nr:hypothetical protein DPEC_G00076580 [Dallia pectoralis]
MEGGDGGGRWRGEMQGLVSQHAGCSSPSTQPSSSRHGGLFIQPAAASAREGRRALAGLVLWFPCWGWMWSRTATAFLGLAKSQPPSQRCHLIQVYHNEGPAWG